MNSVVADIPDPSGLKPASLLALVWRLIAEIKRLWDEVARLRAENDLLKRKNARSATPFSKNQRKKNPKRPGRKPGQGDFRNRTAPAEEDYSGPPEDVPVNETTCPDCGGDLREDEPEIVTNTDIPPTPKPEVKAYRIRIRTCCRCQRKVRGQHPDVAPDQFGATAHRVGARAQAAAQILHHDDGIPVRKVPGVLQTLTGLSMTQSAMTQSAIRLGTGTGPVAQKYQQLRDNCPAQEAINTDDTGWRINGNPAQMMVFESEAQTVYQIRAQHRNEEVREVIGDDYQGTLGTDRGKSYDAKELIELKQQKCVSHLLRSIDEVLKTKSGPARGFGVVLKSQLKEAVKLYKAFHDPTQKLRDYDQRVRALELEVSYHLRPRELKDPDNQRLLNEIGRHHERGNVLRFLHEPTTIEPTNNAAERALRPAVIARKVSHCSKNERGAESYSAFKSVIRTLKKQGGNLLEKLTQLMDRSPPDEATASATT